MRGLLQKVGLNSTGSIWAVEMTNKVLWIWQASPSFFLIIMNGFLPPPLPPSPHIEGAKNLACPPTLSISNANQHTHKCKWRLPSEDYGLD